MVNHLTNPFWGRPAPLGSLLTAAGQRLANELDVALTAAGFADLRSAHAGMFMAVEPDGSRVTELARRARMTKQAAGELVRYLVEHGYFTMCADPADGRAKRAKLTDRGWEALAAGEHVIADFDRWLDQVVGADQVVELRRTLQLIAESDPGTRTADDHPPTPPRPDPTTPPTPPYPDPAKR